MRPRAGDNSTYFDKLSSLDGIYSYDVLVYQTSLHELRMRYSVFGGFELIL